MSNSKSNIRYLDITNLQRIERSRRAGCGDSVSDANSLGICDTGFSDRFKTLRQGMQVVGRAFCLSNCIPWYRE